MEACVPKAVFLSYAAQDAEAARRICDALRAFGVEVWFDRSELRGGEAWDQKIRRRIKECALFLPVISEHSQHRREGYFRLEWRLAEERTHLMAKGTPFLVPVCTDGTSERTALVPDAFLLVQWTRLPGGETPPAFCEQVKRLLAGDEPAGDATSAGVTAPRIADYELLRKIGQGSYGDVWLARGVTGIYRAIKVVWHDRFADAGPFEREFHGLKEFAAISLGESFQLALLHIGRNDEAGFFFYVMELADDAERGRAIDPALYVPLTLAEMRRRRGRLPAVECVTFGVELARALADLHAHGLVHRDIKPSNVILVGGVPKLADIGLVTPAGSARTLVGTEGFVPPEGPGSARADVFALGKLLYELSTGLDRQQFPQLPPELSRLPDHKALLQLNEVVLRACDPLPERRRANGRALLADLTALQAGRTERRFHLGRRLAFVAAAAVVALGLGWLGRRPPAGKPAPAPMATKSNAVTSDAPASDKTLVVFLLENLSPEKVENEPFVQGLHADIITTVGLNPALTVIGRDSALILKRGSATLAELARQVGAAYVITGSVRREGKTVRLLLELRRASDEAWLWSLPNRDRELKDMMALQSEIADEVAEALQARDAKGSFAAARLTTKDPQAYEFFLKSQAAFWATIGSRTESEWVLRAEGIRAAEQALRLDPSYRSAASLLASHYVMAYQAHGDPADRLCDAREAKRWGEMAQRLAPGGAGDGALAHYYVIIEREYGRALGLAENASRAFPNEATCLAHAGLALEGLGRWEEALARYRHARSIDPFKTTLRDLQNFLLASLRRREEFAALAAAGVGTTDRDAIRRTFQEVWFTLYGEVPDEPEKAAMPLRAEWLWRGRRLAAQVAAIDAELVAPTIPQTGDLSRFELWRQKCLALRQLGRVEEAEGAARTVMSLMEKLELEPEGDVSRKHNRRAWAFACAGRRDDAIAAGRRGAQVLAELRRTKDRWSEEIALAKIHAHFGQKRECVELLTRLLRVPSGITVPMLRVEPDWDILREDAGFKALLADPKNDAPL